VIRVYYRQPRNGIPAFTRVLSWFRFAKACYLGFRFLGRLKPDLVHVHILTRHGVIALLNKLFTGTPYLISEHWSRYFPENDSFTGSLRRWITRLVIRRSLGVVAVSRKLAGAMKSCGLDQAPFSEIPNVVDFGRFSFNHRPPRQDKKRIIHISCFDDRSKNISGFLGVLKKLSLVRNDFECLFIGEGPDLERMKAQASEHRFPGEMVVFTGMKEGSELTDLMNSADFLVLSSRYETFGTVVVEAFACGLPVVATNVGIVPEIVNPGNGIVVAAEDEKGLFEATGRMLDTCHEYDSSRIREEAMLRFSPEQVGKQLYDKYREVLHIQ
jgi:glycosyltransferase involved in cell wall biosynthesis